MGFEPTSTQFHSDALTNWAVKPWVELILKANFVQPLQFHIFVWCWYFILAIAFVIYDIYFKQNLGQVITLWAEWLIHMVFSIEEFLEVAIESWPWWNLNLQPLNFLQMFWLCYQAMNLTCTRSQLRTATPVSSLCSVFTFRFSYCIHQLPHLP